MITKQIKDFSIIKGAETYQSLNNRSKGVMLIHGYTGSPSEMILLARKFEEKGLSVCCPRLSGHGTNYKDFCQTSREDWTRSVIEHYLEFSSHVEEVSLIGLSLGGILASYLAFLFKNKKLALLATPYEYPDKKFKYLKLISFFKKTVKQPNSAPALNKTENKKYLIYYNDFYFIPSLLELKKMIQTFHKIVRKIDSDTIIFQSQKDKIVSFRSPQIIFNKVRSKNKRLIYLKKSNHVLSLDWELEDIFQQIYEFFDY